jgi:DNA phosphorothioation-associated DGQHR protein 1
MEIKCIPIIQPIGTFYLAAVKASDLLRLCYKNEAVLTDEGMSGNQRRHLNLRSQEIARYVESEDATLPSSLILSANYKKTDEYVTDSKYAWVYDEEKGSIIIPDPSPESDFKICSVVDGQHRLWAFEDTEEDFLLPCSIFLDLPPSLQAFVFATINFNQKPVSKSDAYQLFGYQLEKSDPDVWSPDLLAVNISRTFNKEGPFQDRIKLLRNSDVTSGWSISSAAFIEGVVSLISGNLKKDKYIISKKGVFGVAGRNKLEANWRYPLRDYYIEGNDKAILEVISRYFDSMSKYLWKGLDDSNIVFKTVGITAQFEFLKYLLIQKKVEVNKDLSFDSVASRLMGLNFSGDYFSARSATKKRLVDAFKYRCEFHVDEDVLGDLVPALGG